MSKFDDMIHSLQQDIEIPDNVWIKYTDTLSKLPDKSEKKSSHTFSKKGIWPVALAAALVIGTISVSAAAYIHWSRGLEERLQATADQCEKLEDNKMSSSVGQSVTQGNITVTAQQSIVDNYFAYISFKVEGFQAEDGEQPGFSGINIAVGDENDYTGGWSASFYDGLISGLDGKVLHADGTPLAEGEKFSYTMEDGSMEFQVEMMSDVKGAFFGKPIHIELRDLGIYGGKAEDVIVKAKGRWNFDWVMTGSDDTKKCELNTPLENSNVTVLNAEISPISVSVTYNYSGQKETEVIVPSFTGVRLKDGTIYTGISGEGICGYRTEDSDIYKDTVALERVIDVDQVESLLFVKSYPEGEQPLTEENLYFVSVE